MLWCAWPAHSHRRCGGGGVDTCTRVELGVDESTERNRGARVLLMARHTLVCTQRYVVVAYFECDAPTHPVAKSIGLD